MRKRRARWLLAVVALAGCNGTVETTEAIERIEVADITTTSVATPTTTEPATTTTTQPITTTTEAPVFVFTGVVGVKIAEFDDPHLGRISCCGLLADDGEVYNLAIAPQVAGLQWGVMVTADGERVLGGSTTKRVVGQDIEDAITGEVVATVGDRVTIIASQPASPPESGPCNIPVVIVDSLEVDE